jgi:two-component system response regulator DesR
LRTLTELLQAWGWTILATSSEGEEALRKIEELKPAVAMLDLTLRGKSGLDIARRVLQSVPETAIVVYSGSNDPAIVREALDLGVRAFVVKDAPLDGLKRALETVAEGGSYVDPVVAALLLAKPAGPQLTERERQVLRLLADGYSYAEIGRQLFISPETVRTYVTKTIQKLGVQTRMQAVATALRAGLIS